MSIKEIQLRVEVLKYAIHSTTSLATKIHLEMELDELLKLHPEIDVK
jgi:hypothetical protein